MQITLIDRLDTKNLLGESVLWDELENEFLWTDIHNKTFFKYTIGTKTVEKYSLPSRLTSFGLSNHKNQFIGAFADGFAWFDISGNVIQIHPPIKLPRGCRFNDGRVDQQGRFWAGTMIEDTHSCPPQAGKFYKLDTYGKIKKTVDGLTISNGLCWSPDSKKLYLADSSKHIIYSYDFCADTGTVSNKKPFAKTPNGVYPDGANVDSEGFLWSAQWGGNRVVRYAPDGVINFVLEMPVPQPTCITFGGENLDLLCVTSAREGLSTDQLKHAPYSGDVFIYQTDISGIKPTRYHMPSVIRQQLISAASNAK